MKNNSKFKIIRQIIHDIASLLAIFAITLSDVFTSITN